MPGVRARRAVLAVLGTLVLLLSTAGPAAAHNALRSVSPSDGQRLTTAPTAVELEFNEPAIALGTRIQVSGPAGDVQQGDAELVDNTVRQPLRSDLPAGRYEVTWRVTSADGHPINGTFTFSVAAAESVPSASPSPSPSASPTPTVAASSPGPTPTAAPAPAAPASGSGLPIWSWVGTAAVALVALAAIRHHQRRSA